MKKLLLLFGILSLLSTVSPAQNKKAEKEAAAKAQFDKTMAAIEAKDFVIIVDTYQENNRTSKANQDLSSFKSYEAKEPSDGKSKTNTDESGSKSENASESGDRTTKTNTDVTNFLSYEQGSVFLQGITAGNQYTNKLAVSEYKQETDKKGNVSISMQVKGFYIVAKIEIFIKKGSNYADVTINATKGNSIRFSGEIVPRAESKYFKRPGEV
jgi:hypothetical protein